MAVAAKWWKDRDNWVPEHLIKIPPGHTHETEEERQSPTEDIGEVADDDSDEFDDVEPPDRGPDN